MSRKGFLLLLYKHHGIRPDNFWDRLTVQMLKQHHQKSGLLRPVSSNASSRPLIFGQDKLLPISFSNFLPSYPYYSLCFSLFILPIYLCWSLLEYTSWKKFHFLYWFYKIYHTKKIWIIYIHIYGIFSHAPFMGGSSWEDFGWSFYFENI